MAWLIYAFLVGASIFEAVNSSGERRWPPADPNLIRDSVTGAYDIRINPHLTAASFTENAICWYANHYEKEFKKESKGNCFQRAVYAVPKDHWAVIDMYPQPVDHFRILSDVRAGKPVHEAPSNDPPRLILHAPKTCDQPHDIVIMIESCASCAAGRQNSRNTFLNRKLWSNVNIGWVFTTGLPARQPTKTFYFPGMTVTRQAYEIGTNIQEIGSKLLAEAREYGDILVSDFEEDGYHYVWAYIVSIRWASVFCNKKVPMFAYMQGHYSIVPSNFVSWLQRLPVNDKPRYFGGLVYHGFAVNHDIQNPWGTSWEELPWDVYPPIVHGMLIILGHETVQEAAILSAYTRYNRNLSLYITIVNRKLRIHPSYIGGIFPTLTNSDQARVAIAAAASDIDRFMDWKTGKAK